MKVLGPRGGLGIGILFLLALAAPAAAQGSRDGSTNCLVCHSRPEIRSERPGEAGDRLFVAVDTVSDSVHGELTCTSCHSGLSSEIHGGDWIERNREAVEGACAGCHEEGIEAYRASIHGTATEIPVATLGGLPEKGIDEAVPEGVPAEGESPSKRPNCVTCHGYHDVGPVDDHEVSMQQAAQCSRCHSERGENFFDRNYHGKTGVLGGYTALCWDCHGAHDVQPKDHSLSRVSDANVLSTCRQCHESAVNNFGDIKIHVTGAVYPEDPKLAAVAVFYSFLLISVFSFFGGQTVLEIIRTVRKRRPAADGGGEEEEEEER